MNRIIYFRNMPLFGKSQKNPVEVVKQIKEAVVALEKGDKKLEKVSVNFFLMYFLYFTLLLYYCKCQYFIYESIDYLDRY